jgi:hypothetical protein
MENKKDQLTPDKSKTARRKRQNLRQQQRIRALLHSFEMPGNTTGQAVPEGGH